jgi:hypothetical protein
MAGRRGRGEAPPPARRPSPRAAGPLLAAAVAASLGGCESIKGVFGFGEPPPPCPRVSILADAARITKFRPGPGRDLVDVLFEGEIGNFLTSCRHDIDRKTRTGTLDVEVIVDIEAARGPADRDRAAGYDYFVALTDVSGNVLQRGSFSATAAFEGNRTRFVFRDTPVHLKIPLKTGQAGPDFLIFLGFQLTPEEMQYNRLQRERGPSG